MSLLTKRSLAIIRELLGSHLNLHDHLEALQEGRASCGDIDIILEELDYYINKNKINIKPDTLEELQEAIHKLRSN